jgi:hypothetical protein
MSSLLQRKELDGASVSYPPMQTARSFPVAPSAARLSNAFLAGSGLRALALSALGICLLITSCSLKPMAKHATAFSTVSTEVIENSEDAYRAAIDLHDREMVSAGVLKVEAGKAWDYDQLTPLMTPEALRARIQILEALKCYAQSLTQVTSGLASPALTAAATSTGTNLKTLGATIKTEPGVAQTGFSISAQTANLVSSATLALGEQAPQRRHRDSSPAIEEGLRGLIAAGVDLYSSEQGKDEPCGASRRDREAAHLSQERAKHRRDASRASLVSRAARAHPPRVGGRGAG